MKKVSFSLLIYFTTIMVSFSQSDKSLFLKLGGTYTTFQDLKYSAVGYGGIGTTFAIGVERINDQRQWGAGFAGNFGKENPNTHNSGVATVINPKIQFHYLRTINDQLSIGAHWDVLGLYFRKIDGLGNNGNYYIASSDLFATVSYQLGKFDFNFGLGVLSFQKEGTGFAFSAPQNGLENGEFDYQNEHLSSPFGFKYYNLKTVANQLNLHTKISYRLNNRFSLAYQWNARRFAEVENHPVTSGGHQVLIRYNIIHKSNGTTNSSN